MQTFSKRSKNLRGSYFNHLSANNLKQVEVFDGVKNVFAKRLKTLKIPSGFKRSTAGIYENSKLN